LKIFFIANCVYGSHVAGGDIHFFNMGKAVAQEGFTLEFLGGHALQKHLAIRLPSAPILLTDRRIHPTIDAQSLSGQFALFFDYFGKFLRSLGRIGAIKADDVAYAVTDYWFDTLPVIFSRAHRKMMVLGMDAPTFRQILRRSRPDVTRARITSVYYWASQNLSLRLFLRCKKKRVFYVHPSMERRLLALGFLPSEIAFISNGFDEEAVAGAETQTKRFDVVWAGRPHAQKGIADLLITLRYLADRIPSFSAILIGNLELIRPEVQRLGLDKIVQFSGYVSEIDKFRIMKQSRVFLMPSRYESWGIVISEALACGLPVVAYDLEPYREIFGNRLTYIPCFDCEKFKTESERLVREARSKPATAAGKDEEFEQTHSWAAARRRFISTLKGFLET
jgi:glycosyltransferase involved in cell wall biosynthesis